MKDATAVRNHVKARRYQVAVEHWKAGSGREQGGRPAKRQRLEEGAEAEAAQAEGEESDDDELTAEELAEMKQLSGRDEEEDDEEEDEEDEGGDSSFLLAELEQQVLGYDSDDGEEQVLELFPSQGSPATAAAPKAKADGKEGGAAAAPGKGKAKGKGKAGRREKKEGRRGKQAKKPKRRGIVVTTE